MSQPRPTPLDDENPEWTAEMFAQARPLAEGAPEVYEALREAKRRGPQKAPRKQMVSIRLDAHVLERFRATGKGWQGRMNDTLAKHLPRARRSSKTTSSKTTRAKTRRPGREERR